MNKVYTIRYKKSNQWSSVCCKTRVKDIINHNSNIKYVYLTIKCMGFELFYYTINLNFVSFFIICSVFDYMFLSMYC